MSDELKPEDIESYNRELRADESGTRERPILIFVVRGKCNKGACWVTKTREKTSQGRRPQIISKHEEQRYVLQKYDEIMCCAARENDVELGDAIFYEAAYKMGRLTSPGTKNLARACHDYNQLGRPVYIVGI